MMTSYFQYNERRNEMGDVVEFKRSEREFEHVDSTTIVEKMELTPEVKAEFEKLGYTFPKEE